MEQFSERLRRSSEWTLSLYAGMAAFACYFCMYGFRKPFTAAEFAGIGWLSSEITLKTALLISQTLGYTISKYAGIIICSETRPGWRATGLVILILIAEAALILFAILPDDWRVLAIFLNGLPLGMVWGFVARYLEGRRTSDLLYLAMSCSIILASAFVKDMGRMFLVAGISEWWMPAVTGLTFLVPFLVSVWMLDQLPPPRPQEEALRTRRVSMSSSDRRTFFQDLMVPLCLFFAANMLLTAFRDFRDNFGIEVLSNLGYAETPALFSRTEIPITLAVLATFGMFSLIQNDRLNFSLLIGTMTFGTVLMGGATWLFQEHRLSGLWWMGLTGLGAFLAYIPLNAIIFDRIISLYGKAATAVFAIYIADATGYTVTVGLLFYKDLFAAGLSREEYLQQLTYATSVFGSIAIVTAGILMLRRTWIRDH